MGKGIEELGNGNNAKIEKLRKLDDVVIFTTTLYKDDKQSPVRQELSLKFLANASALGVRVVVVDGGSNEGFLEKARQFKGITLVPETPGATMGAGRRQALDEAMKLQNASVFFWTEPEKNTLINKTSLGDMVQKIKAGEADIVVPRRSQKCMDSLPKFQRWEEERANKKMVSLLEKKDEKEAPDKIDFWFGPKMFSRDMARYFSEYKGKVDKWDAVLRPVIDAVRDGKKLASVDVDYIYDPSQVRAEKGDKAMNLKRAEQYLQILAAIGDPWASQEGKGLEGGKPRSLKLKKSRGL
ncbi:MAG: hypothetical protein Q7S50_03970 [bacterium]|nr:hypothetical protein [bacterium]